MKRIINLTPHQITVEKDMGGGLTGSTVIEPSGKVARVKEKVEILPDEGNILFVRTQWGEIQNLPEPKDGVYYLVSSIVFAATDRKDVIAVDTGPDSAIRDGNGNIKAVKRLKKH